METSSVEIAVQPIRVRCPSCLKLFQVFASTVQDTRPKFVCSGCQTQFWLPFPECLNQDEFLGFPMEWLKGEGDPAQTKQRPCPKCSHLNALDKKECSHCGILMDNYLEALTDSKAGFKVSRRSRELWKLLSQDYENSQKHDSFIENCQNEKCLDYALYRYERLLKVCPGDEVASRRREEILAKSNSLSIGERMQAVHSARSWLRPRLSTVVSMCGLLLLVVGYSLPSARNIMGVGAALVFLSLMLRFTASGSGSH